MMAASKRRGLRHDRLRIRNVAQMVRALDVRSHVYVPVNVVEDWYLDHEEDEAGFMLSITPVCQGIYRATKVK